MAVKVKIKMTGSDAKKAAKDAALTAMGERDSSGSNYVSRNDLHIGASAANPQGPVKAVKRERSDDCPESWRQKNNRARDSRTALGRGKSANVTV